MLAASLAMLCVVGCGSPQTQARGPDVPVPTAIVDTSWTWTMLITSADHPAIRIDEAGQYTLTFQPDGSLHGAADCQRFAGVFDVSGTELSLKVSRSHPSDCPRGSYARQYLSLLGQVTSYGTDARGLVLHLRPNGGTMVFLPIA